MERESNPRPSAKCRCSTRLSYPVVDVPESNRRTRLSPLLDLSAIVTVATLSYMLRHTPTAQPRLSQPRPCLGRLRDRMLQGGSKLPEIAFQNAVRCMRILGERPKQHAPGYGDPRAFALPREIGVTDLRGRDQSFRKKPLRGTQRSIRAHGSASRCSREGMAVLAK